jgi:hypothetical protein
MSVFCFIALLWKSHNWFPFALGVMEERGIAVNHAQVV